MEDTSHHNHDVEIIDFSPTNEEHRESFKQLNAEWISQYFVMEEADYKALDNPKEYIIDEGGHIFLALLNNTPVGTCALIKMGDQSFEVAKMCVSPVAQGHGIGRLLMNTAKRFAKDSGAKRLYIESNTVLTPAISLYKKSGFVEIVGGVSPYQRCDIQLELFL